MSAISLCGIKAVLLQCFSPRGDNERLERPSNNPQFRPFKKGLKKGIKEKVDKRKLKRKFFSFCHFVYMGQEDKEEKKTKRQNYGFF